MAVLTPGMHVGSYEVTAQLGAGGMGEVYRARDTQLKRDVALKVLPAGDAHDPDRLLRFQREAEVLATLNHPNIATVYGFEEWSPSTVQDPQGRPEQSRRTTGSGQAVGAIVMELVEGETLADRIRRSTFRFEEALPLARQIVDALEAAHERGVIHRDLKPANIKLTADGQVKVLDFGLAKLLGPAVSSQGLGPAVTNSPTMLTGASLPGMILGTAAYMSPEQARGRATDKRADIWSFGCVLFEMLAGTRAFDGEDVTEILGAVIHKEPAWSALPADTPRPVRRIITRCLQKDAKQRFRDIGDVRIELDESVRAPEEWKDAPPSISRPSTTLLASGWVLAAIFAAVAARVGFLHFRENPPPPPELTRFQIFPPPGVTFVSNPVISPDGRKISVGARGADGRLLLWIRSLDSLEARPVMSTDRVFGATVPGGQASFWSPDSRHLAFVADGNLKKVDVSGGPATTIATLPVANTTAFRGGTWGKDDEIVFGIQGTGLWRVPAGGGTPSPLTTLREGDTSHAVPAFLPDGRHFLYARRLNDGTDANIHVGSLDVKPDQQSPTALLATRSGAIYAPSPAANTGYVLFTRDTTLVGQLLDGVNLKLVGDPVAVAEDLGMSPSPAFSASSGGILVFRTAAETDTSRLVWFDRQGKQIGQLGGPAEYGDVFFSPNGKMLVVRQTDPQTRTPHLFTLDLGRDVFTRINPGSSFDVAPAVSSDGRVAFSSNRDGLLGDIYVRQASGAGDAELVVKSAIQKHPNHWSRDNGFLIYDEHHPTQQQDLWIVPMSGDRKPIAFLTTRADETQGQFSPDGKWIAYRSDESGRQEIYVRDFVADRVPAVGSGKWQISTAGGNAPRWRSDGKELYYIAPNRKMMVVAVKSGATFEPGSPVALFDLPNVTGFFPYDMAPDGRFLLTVATDTTTLTSSPITVVVNWMQAISKK